MMKLKHILMAGAAIGTIVAAPAFAGSAPPFHVVALPGGAVTKTMMHSNAHHITYTQPVGSYVSVSKDYKVKQKLSSTFFAILDDQNCDAPGVQKVTLSTRKTAYAKLSTSTVTNSNTGCPTGPTTFYGDVYDLTKKSGVNQNDTFSSTLKTSVTVNGTVYRFRVIFDVQVAINP